MKSIEKSVKAHLFICSKNKQDKACCGEKEADKLVKNLKAWAKENGLKELLKVSHSSCLGHCENGITACLYPQNQWFTNITLSDENKLKELLSRFC